MSASRLLLMTTEHLGFYVATEARGPMAHAHADLIWLYLTARAHAIREHARGSRGVVVAVIDMDD